MTIEIENILLELLNLQELKLTFIPFLKITTKSYNPKISINFEENLGINSKIIDPYEMSKTKIGNNYEFKLDSIEIEIENYQLLRNYNNNTKITISLNVDEIPIIKEYIINITEIKRKINYLINDKIDFRNLEEKDLIAVHVTKKEDLKKLVVSPIFGPKVMYASPWRPSVHFTLNHVVVEHGAAAGGWNDAEVAILISFQELKNLNLKTFYGGITVDISFFGYIRLPKSTIIIYRNPKESWESFLDRINDKIMELNYKLMKGGEWNWNTNNPKEVNQWLRNISKTNSWLTTLPHFNTPIGKIETNVLNKKFNGKYLSDIPKIEANKLFRQELLKEIEEQEQGLWHMYGIHLKAWNSFWNKSLK